MFKLLVFVAVCGFSAAAKLDEVFRWNELQFAWPNEETRQNFLRTGDYIPANNLPLGIGRWKDKLFVTVPR
ncbi:hypothetical protein ILUMI_10288 [Ignelater luminosus]|uniref:Protein yellow n=1 Tax=Ignelater luminosus TaxID=2038154 RepID=A0A8K0D2Q5_IGNLU|nr:hypothetical protein ILUMI_10288 [Ignelater luminosus]